MKRIVSSYDPQGNPILMCDCGNREPANGEPHRWARFEHQPLIGTLTCVTCLSCRRTETLSLRDANALHA